MSPVIDRARQQLVIALDDAGMFAQDVPLGGHNQTVRTDPQADRAIGERRGDTVAIAFEADQTGGRDALAQLDKAVKRHGQRPQRGLLFGPDIGDRAGLSAMRGLPPQLEAALFQPCIQRGKFWEAWHPLQHLMASVANVLPGLPAAIGLEPMAHQWLAPTRPPDCRTPAHRDRDLSWPKSACCPAVPCRDRRGPPPCAFGQASNRWRPSLTVVNAPIRHTAEDPECVPMRIKQHLVGLQGGKRAKDGPGCATA